MSIEPLAPDTAADAWDRRRFGYQDGRGLARMALPAGQEET